MLKECLLYLLLTWYITLPPASACFTLLGNYLLTWYITLPAASACFTLLGNYLLTWYVYLLLYMVLCVSLHCEILVGLQD